MKIAITGASGHVGSNLCRKLIEQNFEINVLYHNDDKAFRDLPLNIIKGELRSIQTLDNLIQGVDIVIHTAAFIAVNQYDEQQVIDTNIQGTKNIIDKCRQHNVKRLIHFSSIHAFNQFPLNQPLNENRELISNSPYIYDKTKAQSETLVRQANGNGLQTIVLSPTSIIGPYDFKPSLVGRSLINIYKRNLPALISGGYDFVDVRDIVDATINAITMAQPGEKYLLSGNWHSIKEFGDLIQKVSGVKRPKFICPLWLAKFGMPLMKYFVDKENRLVFNKQTIEILESGHRNISSAKAKKELNFTCRPLEESIHDAFYWFRNNGYL
ncbi:MAG: NAD-dependent epimerase/dehydratase family protein [Bacteroidota bacterium]